MKRTLFLLPFLCFFLYNEVALADPAAAAVIDAKTGRLLYAFNETQELPMASTTKVMTALIAIDNCDPEAIVTAGDSAYGVPGTSIYLEKGETLTMRDMLLGLMLASGNDAAVAIAEHVGGSVEGFCDMMNARANQLGCVHTHYVTPHGLPAADHYTSALDLCVIAREAMQSPLFRQIVSTQRTTIPWQGHAYDRVLNNKNRLLSTYPGAIGVKTGYTKAAGRCLVFAAEGEKGITLIGSVLNCPDWFDYSASLLDQVFAKYSLYTALNAGEIVNRLPVRNGISDSVELIAEEALSAPLAEGETAELSFRWPQSVPAGIRKGEQIGAASLIVNGKTLCSVPLVAAEAVPERNFRFGLHTAADNWLIWGK